MCTVYGHIMASQVCISLTKSLTSKFLEFESDLYEFSHFGDSESIYELNVSFK